MKRILELRIKKKKKTKDKKIKLYIFLVMRLKKNVYDVGISIIILINNPYTQL